MLNSTQQLDPGQYCWFYVYGCATLMHKVRTFTHLFLSVLLFAIVLCQFPFVTCLTFVMVKKVVEKYILSQISKMCKILSAFIKSAICYRRLQEHWSLCFNSSHFTEMMQLCCCLTGHSAMKLIKKKHYFYGQHKIELETIVVFFQTLKRWVSDEAQFLQNVINTMCSLHS